MRIRESLFYTLLLLLFPLLCSAQTSHVFDPGNGSTVDKLNLVYLYFDETEVADMYKSDDFAGKKWAVRNEEGDSVAGAYIYGYDCPTALLKIQPSIYEKGTYTIDLPEGYLWLYDANDMKTLAPAETIKYKVSGNRQAPTMDAVFSPSPEEPQEYLGKVTFTVDGYQAYNYDVNTGKKITITDESGATVANGMADYDYSNNCGVLNLDKTLGTAGTYTIHIPDNLYKVATDWNAYYSGDYEMLPATDVTYTVSGSDVTVFEVEGGGTSAVPVIKLTFPQHQTVTLNPDLSFACYTIYNADGYYRNFTETWDNLITSEGNVLTLQLYSPLTSPDTYKFSIPEGNLIFEDGSKNTPIAVNFTVVEPKETHVTSTPADGSTLNELYTLTVTADEAACLVPIYDYVSYDVTDEDGNKVTDASGNELSFDIDSYKDNTINLRLSDGSDYTTLTTPGTYHVILPASYFFINEEKTEVNGEIKLTFKVEEGEDTHTYVSWGYYDSNDISTLGALGAGVEEYNVAIFIPGDGVLHGAKLAGEKIPARDASVITSLKAWVATSLNNDMTYVGTADINSPHTGYNTVRFDDTFTVPAEGCYLGYTICVNNDSPLGAAYPVVYDESNKVEKSLYMAITGYGWYDYGPGYGCSALQGLFQDLDLSEASAAFGTIDDGVTQVGTTSDWSFLITTNSESAVNQIEYQIDIDGQSSIRNAVVNIPAGYKQQSKMTVSIQAPEKTGAYEVRLTVTKINGKDNAVSTTAVSTFTNVMKTVTRHTLVEELTGTGCGWCPRGLVGLKKLNEAYGDKVICLAFHQYNSTDPMWCNYASTDELYITGAPGCAIDRKEYADPYYGNQNTGNGIIDEVSGYVAQPAAADISMKAAWTTSDCKEIKIDATLEAFTDDDYKLVYVVTADDLFAESQTWRQANYYAEKSADQNPEDLAFLCEGGDCGSSYFTWRYDDVVIGSSYNEEGINTCTDAWTMAAGDSKQGSFTIALPQDGVIADAIKGSIDKVYAVVFALDSKNQVAQAAKVNVVEIMSDGIEEIENGKLKNENSNIYNLAGQRISTPQKGQIVISNGKKVMY